MPSSPRPHIFPLVRAIPETTAPTDARAAAAKPKKLTFRNSLAKENLLRITEAKSQAAENKKRAMGKCVIAPWSCSQGIFISRLREGRVDDRERMCCLRVVDRCQSEKLF